MNCSFSETFSLSEFSIKDKKNIELIQEDEQLKDYPLRCPICFRIPRFYGTDILKKTIFIPYAIISIKMNMTHLTHFLNNQTKKMKSLYVMNVKIQ